MTTMRRPQTGDTKHRILDTAEALFAENGFKRTTISQIVRRAGVNQAAVNYHFGSKAALVEAVIDRRLAPISQRRVASLSDIRDAWDKTDRPPDVSDLLLAFIGPTFSLTSRPDGGRSFLLIASRALSETDSRIQGIFLRHFEPAFRLLASLVKRRLAHIPDTVLMWRLHFVIGALFHAMRLYATPFTPPDLFPAADHADTVVARLIPFLTAGVQAASRPQEIC
jgi:AcrR family transcriptional regulator